MVILIGLLIGVKNEFSNFTYSKLKIWNGQTLLDFLKDFIVSKLNFLFAM